MKIAIFSDNFYPEISGVADSIILTARALAKRGHKIMFFVPKYGRKDYQFIKLGEQELDLGKNIRIIRLESFPFRKTGQGRAVIPLGRSCFYLKKFKPDVIHVHLPFGTGIEALIVSRILKIPFVGTNHTPKEEMIKNSPIRGEFFESSIMRYNSWFYNQCLFVSSPSQAVLDSMKEFGFLKENRVISNPVGFPSRKKYDKKALKKEYNLSGFNIAYCGRLSKPKCIDVLIKAVSIVKKKIHSVTLSLIGEGNEKENLMRLVNKLGLEKNVLFLGYLDKERINQVYQASEIFSIMGVENQSLAAMQAMANSLLVIGSNAGGFPELLRNRGILVKFGDYKQLAKEIYALYKNPEKRKKLGRLGNSFVKKISSEKIAEIWEKEYSRIIARS